MGLYYETEIQGGTSKILSEDNTVRIEYLLLKCPEMDGEFQTNNKFDKNTICVADEGGSVPFTYANRSLDTHITTNSNNMTFYITDDTHRPVNLTFCFAEL